MAEDGPVDQVRGVQDDHAGRKLHGRGDGVVIPADANAVDVAVIGGDYGIAVGASSVISPLRRLVRRLHRAQRGKEHGGGPVPDVHFFSPPIRLTEKPPWNTAVALVSLSLIHISEPTRRTPISY